MPVPKPDLKMIVKTKVLRHKGVSFRDIGVILRDKKTGKPRDVKTLARWDAYNLKDLLASYPHLAKNKDLQVLASSAKV